MVLFGLSPDMYELWGGGSPFTIIDPLKELKDKAGQSVHLLGNTASLLYDLKVYAPHVKLAWVSCTDEPAWAKECLSKFETKDGESISTCIHSSQIFKAIKQKHFNNLKKEFPEIGYEEMLFFDNERGNIETVSQLKVKCVYCPDGMSEEIWKRGLSMFS